MAKSRAAASGAAALPQPTEHEEQTKVIAWAREHTAEYPALDLLYSVPNGGARSRAYSQHLADEGLRKGVPDLHLPAPKWPHHGLWLELKRFKPRGRVSPEQAEWHERLRNAGHRVEVCYGHAQAIAVLMSYLDASGGDNRVVAG